MDNDILYLLEQWARWRWIGHGAARGFPSMTTFRQQLGSTVPSPAISDHLACAVDHAVAQVCQENEKLGRVLCWYVLDRKSYRAIGRELGISHSSIGPMLQAAVAAVGEVLEG
tara:strand:+ start:34677 stop:35015 length:339 start_codon:yes stop_codon:yes gene_type:complete